MKIIKVLSHKDVIIMIGDYIKATLINGNVFQGRVRYFGDVEVDGDITKEAIMFGRVCVPLEEIRAVTKIKENNN